MTAAQWPHRAAPEPCIVLAIGPADALGASDCCRMPSKSRPMRQLRASERIVREVRELSRDGIDQGRMQSQPVPLNQIDRGLSVVQGEAFRKPPCDLMPTLTGQISDRKERVESLLLLDPQKPFRASWRGPRRTPACHRSRRRCECSRLRRVRAVEERRQSLGFWLRAREVPICWSWPMR